MVFQEDFAEFLDTEQGFAVEATVTPKDGVAYQLKGIFVSNYYPYRYWNKWLCRIQSKL